jgi:hypothetical protein
MIPGPHVTADSEFNAEAYQDFDERLTFFYAAFSTSDAMFVAMPGKGSQYAGAFFDADGERPLGERSYTLHLPADVPVANYWSLVVYDAETRCLLDNGDGFASIASNQNLTLNADGSADLYFGPEPPVRSPVAFRLCPLPCGHGHAWGWRGGHVHSAGHPRI